MCGLLILLFSDLLSVGRTAAEEGSQQVVLVKVNIAKKKKKKFAIFFHERKIYLEFFN